MAGGEVLVKVRLADGHEMPFPEKTGGIAGGLQGLGEEDSFVIDSGFPLRNE